MQPSSSSFQPPEIRATVQRSSPGTNSAKKAATKVAILCVAVSALTALIVCILWEKFYWPVSDFFNKKNVKKSEKVSVVTKPVIFDQEQPTDDEPVIGPPITPEKMEAFTGLNVIRKAPIQLLNTDQEYDLPPDELNWPWSYSHVFGHLYSRFLEVKAVRENLRRNHIKKKSMLMTDLINYVGEKYLEEAIKGYWFLINPFLESTQFQAKGRFLQLKKNS